VLFSILAPATFPTLANLQTILGTQAVLLIMTLRLLIPLTSGEFDLSVGATIGFAAIVVGFLNVQHGWPILAAADAAPVVELAFGSLNAFLVVRLGVPSLVIAGCGASGRNGGWLTANFPLGPAMAEARFGREAARAVLLAMNDTVDEGGRVVAAEGIDEQYVATP
jgi:ABC-type xylose transport system permease subunit